jgi:hypothetical protein
VIIVTDRRVASTIIEARDRGHSVSSSINSATKTPRRKSAGMVERAGLDVERGRHSDRSTVPECAVRRRTARSRLHLTQTRVDPGSPSLQARFFSRRRELICAIRIGPRENSPACAFRVNPRR